MTTVTRSLRHEVPANPAAPLLVRRRLKAWLSELAWPQGHAADVLLATSEAVTNSVHHAYRANHPGWVQVTADHRIGKQGTRQVEVSVTDQGRWIPAQRPASGQPVSDYQGRGLVLMRALTESLRIDATEAGTSVTMTSYPVSSRSGARTRIDPATVS